MQRGTAIDQRDPELDQEIGCVGIDLSRRARRAYDPAPVLLFEWKHYTVAALRVITLRVEACAAGGKPSTWLPPGELVEQL